MTLKVVKTLKTQKKWPNVVKRRSYLFSNVPSPFASSLNETEISHRTRQNQQNDNSTTLTALNKVKSQERRSSFFLFILKRNQMWKTVNTSSDWSRRCFSMWKIVIMDSCVANRDVVYSMSIIECNHMHVLNRYTHL